jgi:hypothetical protein
MVEAVVRPQPWNKGKLVGQKAPPGFRLKLGAGPTRPIVRKAFAIVCGLRRVALPSPPCALS